MKIKEVKAFKTEDGYLFSSKEEAIQNNIDNIIDEINSEAKSYDLIQWFKLEENKNKIRYLMQHLK